MAVLGSVVLVGAVVAAIVSNQSSSSSGSQQSSGDTNAIPNGLVNVRALNLGSLGTPGDACQVGWAPSLDASPEVSIVDGGRVIGSGTLANESWDLTGEYCVLSASITWVSDPEIARAVTQTAHGSETSAQNTPVITRFRVRVAGFNDVPVTMVAGTTDLQISAVQPQLSYDAALVQQSTPFGPLPPPDG